MENLEQLTVPDQFKATSDENNDSKDGVEKSNSNSSRIMSVRETSPILMVALYFVFANIFFNSIVSLISLVILLILCGIFGYHYAHPNYFHNCIAVPADKCIYRIKIFPFELLIVLGIFYTSIVQITNPFEYTKLCQFNSCMLIVMAYYLTELGNKVSYTGHRGGKAFWELSIKPLLYQLSGKRRKPPNSDSSTTLVVDEETIELEKDERIKNSSDLMYTFQEKENLQRDQMKRWKKWIQEEMRRLSGDSTRET